MRNDESDATFILTALPEAVRPAVAARLLFSMSQGWHALGLWPGISRDGAPLPPDADDVFGVGPDGFGPVPDVPDGWSPPRDLPPWWPPPP